MKMTRNSPYGGKELTEIWQIIVVVGGVVLSLLVLFIFIYITSPAYHCAEWSQQTATFHGYTEYQWDVGHQQMVKATWPDKTVYENSYCAAPLGGS